MAERPSLVTTSSVLLYTMSISFVMLAEYSSRKALYAFSLSVAPFGQELIVWKYTKIIVLLNLDHKPKQIRYSFYLTYILVNFKMYSTHLYVPKVCLFKEKLCFLPCLASSFDVCNTVRLSARVKMHEFEA